MQIETSINPKIHVLKVLKLGKISDATETYKVLIYKL